MSLNIAATTRYSAVAIALHWILAILALSMVPVGWWMGDAILDRDTRAQALEVFPLHKATGMTILALTVLRLVWRATHTPPPLPQRMRGWERTAARATHWLFYGLLLALPLSGWLYSSVGWSDAFKTFINVPTSWFGLFDIPPVPGVATLDDDVRRDLGEAAMEVHGKLAWAMLLLAGLHVAAALKHHFIDRDDVLTRMVPLLKPRA
ncbi:MAG: cytochrome b [Hyphomonadaceae bacterium]|nr:cytochrome b [Hyphomonadaceae bacterium]